MLFMISKVMGSTISGFLPCLVSTEVGIQKGLPKFEIVGLGQSAVKEGKDRIMTAIKSSGFMMSNHRIIVNLAPASVKKEGSSLDLPIALGILAGTGSFPPEYLPEQAVAIGELSLDGSIQSVRGIFAMIQEFKEKGVRKFIIPWGNTHECELFDDVEILPAKNLRQVIECLQNQSSWPQQKRIEKKKSLHPMDWSDVKGQPIAKRVMEIAAAGGHHVLLSGTPGVGKTLLAKRFSTILPELTQEQEREVRKIHSIEGILNIEADTQRPFRMPHHHASLAGMIGGGRSFRIGEFSLAHQGVLFMDEFPEFRRDIVEALREPLEEGLVRISRAEGSFVCPSRFQLIAAMNMCPCGSLGDEKKSCICTPWAVQKYRNKLSRPIQDRLDLYVELKNVDWKVLWDEKKEEASHVVRQRVLSARQKQMQRYELPDLVNANLSSKILLQQVRLDSKTEEMMESFVKKEGVSLRSLEKIIRISRTIADLDDKPKVEFEHVCEALQYRPHAQY